MVTLIKSAQIVDGTGQPPFKGDILIKDSRISAIGAFLNQKTDTTIDGLGLTVTPGFIDANTDSDHYLTLFTNPLQKDFLFQGVTTIIGGQCGSSLAPLLYGSLKSFRKWADINEVNVDWGTVKELKHTITRLKPSVNFGTLVGHSTVRRDLIGEEIRDLTATELEVFKNTLSQALKEGSLGLSTGLGYAHSRHVPYSEIKSLLEVVQKAGGVYTTHLRDEKENLIQSIKETVQMAEASGVPTIISHFRPIFGFETQFQQAMSLIENNLNRSNVYFDINPFDVSVLPVYTLLPLWAQQGNFENMREILSDPNHRARILEELSRSSLNSEQYFIAEAKDTPSIIGKTLKEFSESRGVDVYQGLLALMEITKMKSLLFYKNINLELLKKLLFHPRSLIGSNSASFSDSQITLKPERSVNTFPEFFRVTLEKKVPLEEVVKKITFVPAKLFKLEKRGALLEGWAADLVMLKGTAVTHVMVNGEFVVLDQQLTGNRPGIAF